MKRFGVIVILLLAFLGMADAAYLAKHEISGTELICNIESLSGCNTVAESVYSHIFGIPVAVYGVIFYAVIFFFAALELVMFNYFLRRAIQVIAVAGIIAEVIFTFIQVYLINALCVYCLASAVIALLILVFATLIEPVRRNKSNLQIPSYESTVLPKQTLRMPPIE